MNRYPLACTGCGALLPSIDAIRAHTCVTVRDLVVVPYDTVVRLATMPIYHPTDVEALQAELQQIARGQWT